MREAGGRVVFDIDYRPNLWGLGGHSSGQNRFVASRAVSERLGAVLPECDLIVGTEEEVHIAGGTEDTLTALRAIRRASAAAIVLKRGPMGCVVYAGAIPDVLEDGVVGRGFPIEVYNVLGAGDAFLSGFLRGWLRGESHATSATWANACGAFAVSRLLCSPESPAWLELQHFLERGSPYAALRKDPHLNHLHWATTRRRQPSALMALAIDHRAQLEEVADRVGAPRAKIAEFKTLAVEAAARVAKGRCGFGMLLDSTYGGHAFSAAARKGLWIGRPVESPGSRPLEFDGLPDLGSHLAEWPVTHTVKCLCFYHPDDAEDLKTRQERELLRVNDAVRTVGRELLIEVIAGKNGALNVDTVARVVSRLYAIGIRPDWWKLEPQRDQRAWLAIGDVIRAEDSFCRGIVMLGLEAPEAELVEAFAAAQAEPLVKGFAVGRTIFAEPAAAWLAETMDDETAVGVMEKRFRALVESWRHAGARVGACA